MEGIYEQGLTIYDWRRISLIFLNTANQLRKSKIHVRYSLFETRPYRGTFNLAPCEDCSQRGVSGLNAVEGIYEQGLTIYDWRRDDADLSLQFAIRNEAHIGERSTMPRVMIASNGVCRVKCGGRNLRTRINDLRFAK